MPDKIRKVLEVDAKVLKVAQVTPHFCICDPLDDDGDGGGDGDDAKILKVACIWNLPDEDGADDSHDIVTRDNS